MEQKKNKEKRKKKRQENNRERERERKKKNQFVCGILNDLENRLPGEEVRRVEEHLPFLGGVWCVCNNP